jgi:hypothetical protein
MSRDLLAHAIAAAQRGWHVFPLNPDAKTPLTWRDPSGEQRGWQWTRHASDDHNTVARFWAQHPGCNVGIACGPSGLVVVDLDTPKPGQQRPREWEMAGVVDGVDVFATLCHQAGQPFPFDTFTVQTGRGGLHLYFAAPDGVRLGNSGGALGWLIDTRGAGGYVVGPGSVVDGNSYAVLNDAAPTPLPSWLAERLTAPHEPAAGVQAASLGEVRAPAGYAGAALRGEVAKVLAVREGERNNTLYAAARRLGELIGARLLPEHLVIAALQQAAASIRLSDREASATIRSGIRAGVTQPRKGVA